MAPRLEDSEKRKPTVDGALAILSVGSIAAATLGVILWLGVPVLYMDEWTLIGFIEKVRAGTTHFQDFWIAYAEHRIFLPRLFFALVYRSGPLDPRPLMWSSWLVIGVVTCAASHRFFWRGDRVCSTFSKLAFTASFATMTFSLVQYENWLWGLQFDFFLTQAFVLAASVILTADSLAFSLRLFLIAVCAAASSCSSGQGVLLWISAAVGLLLLSNTFRTRVAVCVLLSGGLLFFVWQYKVDSLGQLNHASEFGWVLKQPVDFCRGILALAGAPTCYWAGFEQISLAPIFGLILCCVFIVQSVLICRSGRLRAAAPYFSLCIFGFLYCWLVTLGRATHGYNEWFVTSRYTTHALLIPIGMLGLSWELYLAYPFRRAPLEISSCCRVVPAVLAVLVVAGSWQAVRWASQDSNGRRFAAHLIPVLDRVDSLVDGVSTGPFYPLCPVDNSPVIQWGIRPAIAKGLVARQPVSYASIQIQNLQLSYESKPKARKYLGHRIYAGLFSGTVIVPKSCHPDALLIGKNSDFSFAAPLRLMTHLGGDSDLYGWTTPISPSINSMEFQRAAIMLFGWEHGNVLWKTEAPPD